MRISKVLFFCLVAPLTVACGFYSQENGKEEQITDNEIRKAIIQERLKELKGSRQEVTSKYQPRYPDSGEREYIRLCDSCMAIEKQVLLKYLPELKRIINDEAELRMDSAAENEEKRKKQRFMNLDNTFRRLRLLFESIRKELDSSFGLYGLKRGLNKIAALDHKLSVSEWKKVVSKTFGINLLEDYYSGEYYQVMLDKWVSDNVDLITSIKDTSLDKMKELVYMNYMEGRSTTDIVKEIRRQYGVDKRRARLIARDQTAKLNANITKSQQQDAGVSKYKWSSSRDRRVRKSHRELDGKIFSWDSPPETDGGRHCHPGEDYQCRCCALPIFDLEELDLPM